MSENEKKVEALNLGTVTSYGLAKKNGFVGTNDEWVQKIMHGASEDQLDEAIEGLSETLSADIEAVADDVEALESKVDALTAEDIAYSEDKTAKAAIDEKINATTASTTFVHKPTESPDGTNGQLLRSKGDGTTEWTDYGLPTDEQTSDAITAWLDDHPEATTTVQDGAITAAKLHSDIKDDVLSIPDLKSAIIQEIDIGDPYETAGLISGQTGAFSANAYFTASDYIDISDYAGINIYITCSLYNASGYAFYDSGKTYIADSGYNGTAHGSNVFGTFEASVPSNAKYVRFSLFNSDASYSECGISVSVIDDRLSLKLNKPSLDGTNGQILQSNGDGSTSWVDFSAETDKTLSIEDKAADAKAVGDFILEQINIGNGVPNAMINGDNGTIGNNNYFVGSDWIDVSAYAGSKIVVKCGFYNAIGLAFYTGKSSSAFIVGSGVSGNSLGENGLKSVVVAVPATAVYLRFSIINTQGTYTDCSVTASKIATIRGEIEKLTYAKDYERRLVLCPQIRMAEGIEYSFHYDNMVRGFRPADADMLADQYLAGYDGYAKFTPDSTNPLHNNVFSQNGLNTYLNCKFVEPDMGNLSKSFKKFAVAADAGAGKSLTGIFIGDSFTQAAKYIKNLIETCAENGITLTSLGTMSTTISGTPVTQEGRGGWRAYDYAHAASKTVGGVTLTNPFFNNGVFDFSYYMTQQGYSGLDFVGVFLGVNDVIGSTNTSDEDILDSLNAIITSIRAYSNNLPIYLWLPPTRCIAPTNGTKRRYYLPNLSLVDVDAALRYNCLVVDNFSDASGVEIIPVGWNVDPMYDYNITEENRNTDNSAVKEWHVADAIHPSDRGYKHISDVIYGTMLYLVSKK